MFITNGAKISKRDLVLMLFAMLYITADLASNVVLYKQVQIGQALFPGGVFVVPFIYCLSDVIAETYGFNVSKWIIWLGIICDFVFVFFVTNILSLPSPSNWTYQGDFNVVFGSLLRANLASVLGIICGSFINIYILSKFKVLLRGKYFWLRSIAASMTGELIVLITALPILYWGVVPGSHILQMGVSEYILRLMYAIVITVPASIIVGIVKSQLKLDTYDIGVNYNPFRLNVSN